MDLISLRLSLRPLPAPDPTAPLPEWWGRAAHALLLDVVRQADPALAESLHADNEIRPFSVSSLRGLMAHGALDPQTRYTLRLSAFSHPLAEILNQAALDGPLCPGQSIELDYLPFAIEAVSSAPGDPQQNTYAGLSAPYLLAKTSPPRQVRLRLESPTTFKSGGKHIPVPLPELAFGSLLERWNAFAPVRFPPELKRYASECLAIGRYQLGTRAIPLKGGGLRVGAQGEVTFTTLNYDRYWQSLICTLADFACYAGLGAGTSMGLGQCRRSM